MCCLLVDQFTSVFTTPDPKQIVTDPISYFDHEPITDISPRNNYEKKICSFLDQNGCFNST